MQAGVTGAAGWGHGLAGWGHGEARTRGSGRGWVERVVLGRLSHLYLPYLPYISRSACALGRLLTAAVDDEAAVVDGERGLGDIRAQHHLQRRKPIQKAGVYA